MISINKEKVIEIYNDILQGKRKRFSRGFWDKDSKIKAKIIFQYLFEEILKWDIKKIMSDFDYSIVSQYKLTSPYTQFYNKSVGNILRDIYSTEIKGKRLPVSKETKEKISIAQKNLSKEKRDRITQGRIKLNNDKKYIKKLSNTKLGEKNPKHKLKIEEVREIKQLWTTELYTTTKLGEKFGVKRQTIADIVYGRTWKHV